MTTTCLFSDTGSSSTTMIHANGVAPTRRGASGIVLSPNAPTFLPWPSGTIAGDLAVIACMNGYGQNAPAGWTTLYNSNNQSGVDGGAFYKILDAADITAGGVTINYISNDIYARGVIATYADGASLNVFLYGVTRITGTTATHSYPLAALAGHSYFVWGAQWANGAVTFAQATNTANNASAQGSSAFGLYDPPANAAVTETVSFASASQSLSLIVAITKGGTVGRTVTSTAISAASSQTRWAIGPLYFEMLCNVKAGTTSVGLVNRQATFGAASLGATTSSIAYQSDGLVRCGNVTLATISPYTTNDRVCVAHNPSLNLIWFKVNGGSWNNNGLANPATGVGGIDISSWVADLAYPAVGFSVGGASFTAAFASADFAYSPPSGYYSISEDAATVVTVAHNSDSMLCPFSEPFYPTDWVANGDSAEDYHSNSISYPAGPIKLIAGEVRENDVGVEGRLVRMYNRRTGEFVGEARTNALGEFIIPAQDPNLPHFVVAFDDDMSPDYNAKVYDNVLPG